MKQFQRIFRVLGNPRRMAIMQLLMKRRELSVSTIASAIELSMTSTSKHLIAMANTDLLEKRQERITVFYRIPDNPDPRVGAVIKLLSSRQ
jgi:DNA-binding transcriptional ArsR family regulator